MKKRLAGFFLLAVMAMLVCAGPTWADFVKVNGNTMYKTESGSFLKGLQKIDGEYYYFDASGILKKKGWIKTSEGKEYYASKTGVLLRNQWFKNKRKYYLTETGEKAKGITRIGKALFYFSPTTGKLQKGKLKDPDGNFYITNDKGVVYRGQLFKYKGKRYYAHEDGRLAKGLTKIGNYYYFFRPKNGRMLVSSLREVDGAKYYFRKRGRAACNRWVKIKNKYYYFQEDGRMATNQFVGKWYVDENGVRKKASEAPSSGVRKSNGKYYIYDTNGKLVKNSWAHEGEDTYYAGSDGAALIGFQTIQNKKYYFDEKGVLQKDTIVKVGSKYYVAAADGQITGTTQKSGAALVAYAKKFLGLPYVWGGTSLKKGADCSGFCLAVHAKFGITLMRVADDQMKGPSKAYQKLGYKKGIRIKDKDLEPGDLVFYDSNKDGVMDHVAMYIGKKKGKGQVIHEAGKKYGCVITAIDWAHGRVANKNMRYWA